MEIPDGGTPNAAGTEQGAGRGVDADGAVARPLRWPTRGPDRVRSQGWPQMLSPSHPHGHPTMPRAQERTSFRSVLSPVFKQPHVTARTQQRPGKTTRPHRLRCWDRAGAHPSGRAGCSFSELPRG